MKIPPTYYTVQCFRCEDLCSLKYNIMACCHVIFICPNEKKLKKITSKKKTEEKIDRRVDEMR